MPVIALENDHLEGDRQGARSAVDSLWLQMPRALTPLDAPSGGLSGVPFERDTPTLSDVAALLVRCLWTTPLAL